MNYLKILTSFIWTFALILPIQVEAEVTTQTLETIGAGKVALIEELLKSFSVDEVANIVSDPRLFLDETVVRKGATGAGFDYFSADYALVSDEALSDGLEYRSKNWKSFRRTYEKYGTESYYILGILRLETYFGEYKGRRSVLNSLYSIYVQEPKRRNFAGRELKSLILMAKKNKMDSYALKGSTAGAFGIPQFIPSSALSFAVDGSGDGSVDLYNNSDAIMSVGNYLKKNGWGKTETEKRASIYAYNHDDGYVNAVMSYAAAIEQEVNKIYSR